jgi:hypothetical protein
MALLRLVDADAVMMKTATAATAAAAAAAADGRQTHF